MIKLPAAPRSRMQPETTIRRAPFDPIWRVPDHLRGLACQVCGSFFQDGESHGALDLFTGAVTCQTRTILVRGRTQNVRGDTPSPVIPPDLPLCRWGSECS